MALLSLSATAFAGEIHYGNGNTREMACDNADTRARRAATGELLGAMTVALPEAMANTASQGTSGYPQSSASYPAPSYPVRRDSSTSAAGIR